MWEKRCIVKGSVRRGSPEAISAHYAEVDEREGLLQIIEQGFAVFVDICVSCPSIAPGYVCLNRVNGTGGVSLG